MSELEKTEKITINLGLVDLGQIDLLVQEGFYSNRTDFIRTATRTQLVSHAEVVKRTVARKTLVLGVQHYTRRDLEALRRLGKRYRFTCSVWPVSLRMSPQNWPWRPLTRSRCLGLSGQVPP
jgi:Arc/MetJ-type ribon-helix-helix transcriptional regulator